ncbi:polysaccharide biosynthesis protein [Candidatus Pelagibacter bacterium]|nr:nucleoside-diphosphate sugar epimerase/dehydratase [Candidatus Pelagibacter bacterium]MDA8836202.1 polysaccharide biosynthesis protein [Candidatus Pelagibacter bacterium]
MSSLSDAPKNVINLPRYAKKTIAIIIDLGLCTLCTWLAFYLRLEQFIKINNTTILAVLISITLAIPIFWLLGLYRTMFRFAGSSIVFTVAVATLAYGLTYFAVIGIYGIPGVPRSIGIIQPLLLFLGILSSRIIIKNLFINTFSSKNFKNKKKVLIYGAGSAGRQLLASLENNPEMKVVGFLDDNQQFQNQTILGQTVFDPLKINELINLKNIDQVLLALPSISRKKRNQIINDLNNYKVIVKTLPSIQDIVDGKISVSDIKDLTIEDLLSRDQVQPNLKLLSKNINSKVVLVTGAGGSIGSELCRQITRLNPKKLLLLELNEFDLYNISEELKNLTPNFKIVSLLANIQNSSRVNEIFKIFKVDTVYHAAAYKHVPLVEENICEGVKNNVFGTYSIGQIAIQHNVSNFVLISSDKAVRATNIMGASKRLAEICVQSLHNDNKDKHTKFAIVRFGNVLQSSGSVIPKFKKQIKQGGPVTLTHPEVTRYFMTITEASQLVIQAGAMSEGCEVFILDMGESVKIKDLIYKMIKLSGLIVKNIKNPEGDIEVKITGLRPGEKLYEELLLGDNPQKTYHERIQKAQDPYIPFNQLKIELDNLSNLLNNNKVAEVKNMLDRLLPSYQSNSKIVDHIYEEQLNFKNDFKTSNIVKDQENKVIRIKTK